MKELIIMTAASRKGGLKQCFDSIESSFKKVSDVHVTWLICYDKYNGKENLDEIVPLCKKALSDFGMGWLIFRTGKEGQANYGGDMYNEALKWIKQNWFKNTDSWVYILDDDNIVHPALAQTFVHIADKCEENGKKMVWLTMSHDYAGIQMSHEFWNYAYHVSSKGERYTFQVPDPSQILMKYSEIEKMGMYVSGFEYDRKLWKYFELNYDDVLFSDDWLECKKYSLTTQIQSYHNGQILDKTVSKIDKEQNRSYYLVCQDDTLSGYAADRIVVPQNIGDECYRKVKNIAKDRGYITDDRIFKNIDRIFILTQADTPHRWNFVIDQFKKLGIYDEVCDKLELVKGVKIPGVNEEVVKKIFDEGLGNPIYMAEKNFNVSFFNCTNEHFRILSRAIAEGYNNIMVIEDDACFLKDLSFLKKAISNMPEDFKVLHLEGFLRNSEDLREKCLGFLSSRIEEAYWGKYEDFPCWASACLIYSRKGMEEYVSKQKKYLIGVDNRLGDIVEGAYIYSFPLVRQEDRTKLRSGIEVKEIADSSNLYLTYSNKEDYFSMFD